MQSRLERPGAVTPCDSEVCPLPQNLDLLDDETQRGIQVFIRIAANRPKLLSEHDKPTINVRSIAAEKHLRLGGLATEAWQCAKKQQDETCWHTPVVTVDTGEYL